MIPLIWLAGAGIAAVAGAVVLVAFWKEIVAWVDKVMAKLPPSVRENLQGAVAFVERVAGAIKNLMNYYSYDEQTQKWTETVVSREVDESQIPKHIREKMKAQSKVDITDDLQEQLELVNA